MSEKPAVLHVRPERVADGTQSLSLERGAGLSVTAVTSRDAALETLSSTDPDYLVCEHRPDDGLDGLAVVDAVGDARPDLPALLCTAEPDGRVAAEATRRGVAEYVPRSETDPGERLRALAADGDVTARSAIDAVEATTGSLRKLTRLAADDGRTDAETIEGILRLGADRLGLSLGYLGRIEGDTYAVEHVVGDHALVEAGASSPLSATYCEHTSQSDTLFPLHDAAAEGWADHPSYRVGGIACYLGGRVSVNGETYGTVCFADEEPRATPFTNAERAFVELLVQWVSDELKRRHREAELERYEDIIEAVDDGVYALDDEGNFVFVNEAMTALTGYDAEALLGAHTGHIKTPEVVEEAEGIVREMIFEDRDDEATFDLSIQRADDESFPAEDHMTVLWDDGGRFEGTAGVIRDITDRKERELELREANRRIEQILGRIGAAFFAVDDDWNLTYWNAQAEAVLGRDAEAVMGENLWEAFPDATESAYFEAYREAMDSQEPVVFEEYYPPAEKWFRVNAYPSTDGLSVYFHDITDQKERDRKLSGLLETTRSLMHAHTDADVAETVVEAAESRLGFDLNLVRLYDGEAETLYPVAWTDGVPDRPVYDADESFAGEAFQRGETVRIDDFDHVDNYDRDANAAMCVPIGDYGVLSVATTESDVFDDADVSVAEILASNAAAALSRVDREEDLRRYEAVVENVRDMVYVIDEDGEFQLVTEPLAEWLGFDREAMLGERPAEFLDRDDVATFERHIREMQADRGEPSRRIETSLVTADGAERPAEVEVSLIDHDRFRGTVGVVRDRTELEQAREDLRDERDRFSYLFNNLPDAVAETESGDDGSVVRSVNPAFTDVFGVDHATALDERLGEFVQPPTEASSEESSRFTDADGNETVRTAEIRRRTDDGFRDFLFRGIPYRRDDGRVWGFCIYTDITDQKERERRLEVLNRVLRHNLRNDLTVVLGLADALAARLDDEDHLSLLDRLQRKTADVASLSDRAREIERSIRRGDADSAPVPVVEAVASLVETYERSHDVTVETAFPETDARAADGRFTRVVEELLNNGVEHAGADPGLSLEIGVTEREVSVTVADEGPGIPAHELDVLTGEEPITQLSHSSGLGLWLVVWLTESYGGTVTFDGTDETGTVVTLTLPRTGG
ncbi:PAS domain S-box protein [Haloarcula limicola]|uniref:PAS domain S-box protein n=1 Tax=Haloarcula limicola TaxID=1429915 RepID=UPI001F5046BA|nr:PAS domain S-box protein [Halomicroarcula limicola]